MRDPHTDPITGPDQPPRPAGGDRVMPRPPHTVDCASQMTNAAGERYECDCRRRYTPAAPAPEAGRAVCEACGSHPFDKRGADRMAREIARLVQRGVIGSRSDAADALLDYDESFCTDTAPAHPAPAPDDAAALGFTVEDRGGIRVVQDRRGVGCRPATNEECALWDALAAARAREGAQPAGLDAAYTAGGTMQETQVQDWRTLPAGRELDALVAERVLGYEWRRAPRRDVTLKALVPPDEFPVWSELRGDEAVASDFARFCPRFSTDIAAAWLVVERLADDDLSVVIATNGAAPGQNGAKVFDSVHGLGRHMFDAHRHEGWYAVEETVPLAICRAALAAVEGRDHG